VGERFHPWKGAPDLQDLVAVIDGEGESLKSDEKGPSRPRTNLDEESRRKEKRC